MAAEASGSSSTSQEAVQATIFQRLHPRAYLERFLAKGFRPDGREESALVWRNLSVNVGSISTADGSALVRLGDTTIVCGVKAEIAEPDLDSPENGFLVPNLDLPAICSPKFKPGPPAEEAQVLSERLYDALLCADVLSLSSLCIQPGKAVWTLYIDATCINYDGNAFDAALIAMVAALRNTRLPKATYHEESERTTCTRRVLEPLRIGHLPIAVTFGIFDATHVLPDPTSFEEPLLDSTISVVVNERGELSSISQFGVGVSVAGVQDIFQQYIAAAKQRRRDIDKTLGNII